MLVRLAACSEQSLLPGLHDVTRHSSDVTGGVYERHGRGGPGARLRVQEGEDPAHPDRPHQHARLRDDLSRERRGIRQHLFVPWIKPCPDLYLFISRVPFKLHHDTIHAELQGVQPSLLAAMTIARRRRTRLDWRPPLPLVPYTITWTVEA